MSSRAETSSPEQATLPPPARRRPKAWFWIAWVLVLLALLTARVLLGRRLSALPVLVELPAYSLTNQQGQAFGATNLRGKPYIANFVFTSCPSVCPRLTKRMVEVQDRTRDLGEALPLVTFTVDPETDTPDVLRAYAQKYGADTSRWVFLTGQLGAVEPVVVQGFKMMMGKKTETTPGMFEIVHGERFVLVDAKGFIRGFYEATDEGIAKIVGDARGLVAD